MNIFYAYSNIRKYLSLSRYRFLQKVGIFVVGGIYA